jgi:hypothetical protein
MSFTVGDLPLLWMLKQLKEEGAGEGQVVHNDQWGFICSGYLVLISAGNYDRTVDGMVVKFVSQLLTDDGRYCLKPVTSKLFESSVQDTSSQARLLHEMKVWYLLMSLKPNESHLNGTPHHLHCKEVLVCKLKLESNAECIFVEKALSIMNLCSRNNSVYFLLCWGWCHIYGIQWEESNIENGIIDWSYTMTTPHNTQLWQCSNSWWKNKSH